jgi:hypothetical protein
MSIRRKAERQQRQLKTYFMKDYNKYKNVSKAMRQDPKLIQCLEDLAKFQNINYIVETGTYNGLGSTTMIAKAFEKSSSLKKFFTIEINYPDYKKAKKNLSHFSFVNCLYGCSVNLTEALDFVSHDNAILNHEAYPDIYIDHSSDPVGFYTYELTGGWDKARGNIFKRLLRKQPQSELLKKLLNRYLEYTLLVVLDSAGGVGQMEFSLVSSIMKDHPHFLLLDDIHHLKHFRSYGEIKSNKKYKILGLSTEDRWVIAQYM